MGNWRAEPVQAAAAMIRAIAAVASTGRSLKKHLLAEHIPDLRVLTRLLTGPGAYENNLRDFP